MHKIREFSDQTSEASDWDELMREVETAAEEMEQSMNRKLLTAVAEEKRPRGQIKMRIVPKPSSS